MVPVLILAGVAGITVASAYVLYHAFKVNRPGAITPAESWLVARWHRSKLDTELARILGTTETR